MGPLKRASGLTISIAASLALAAGGSGHAQTVGPSPTAAPGTPQGLAATAGLHTVHLSWTAVAGATGYRIYTSDTAGVTTAAPSVFVNTTTYDFAGLPNWHALYARVAADIDVAEGALSTEVSATPTAGLVLAQSASGATLDAFHADELGVGTDPIANGKILLPVGTTGAVYGVAPATDVTEIGFAMGGSHVVYANQVGHHYVLAGIFGSPARAVVSDKVGPGGTLRSYLLDGTDAKVLATNCASLDLVLPKPDAAGLVFECDDAALGYQVWYTNGASPAILLPENANFVPIAVTPTRAIFSNGTGALYSQSFDANPKVPFSTTGATQSLIAMNAAGRLLIKSTNLGHYYLNAVDSDGNNNDLVDTSTTDFVFAANERILTNDGSYVLGTVESAPKKAILFLLAHDAAKHNLDVTGPAGTVATDDAAETHLLDNDDVITNRAPPATVWVIQSGTTSGTELASLTSGTEMFFGAHNNHVLFIDPGHVLHTSTTDGVTNRVLDATSSVVPPIFRTDDQIIWVHYDGTTMIAKADGTGKATVDSVLTPLTTSLTDAGTGSGGRVYVSLRRSATAYDVLLWDTVAAAPTMIVTAKNPASRYLGPVVAVTNALATATSSTSVTVTWLESIGATSYEVFRSSGSGFVSLGTTGGPPFIDNTASANTAYLYQVRVGAPSVTSFSAPDLATTVIFTNPALTVNSSLVKAVDFIELRTAVNAVRVLAGIGAHVFGTTLTPNVAPMLATAMTELRSAIDPARAALSLPPIPYTHPSISAGASAISAADINDLRTGVK